MEGSVAALVLVLFLSYFGLEAFKNQWVGDLKLHCAAVASLYLDFVDPPHEAFATPGSTSNVHTPYVVVVAGMGRLLRVSPYRALQLAALLNLALYAFAIGFFFRTFSLARRSWLPPLFFLLVNLFMREHNYFWSSETSFHTLGYIQAYPSFFGWGLAITTFALASRWLRDGGVRRPVLVGLLVGTALLSHNLTGSWVVGIVGVLGLTEVAGGRCAPGAPRRVLLLYGAVAAGAAATMLWPYFDVTRSSGLLHFQEGSTFADHPFKDLAPLYTLAALAGVWFISKRQHGFLLAGFAATGMALQFFRVLNIPYGNRYAFFQAFFAQVAVAELAALGLLMALGRRELLPEDHAGRMIASRWVWAVVPGLVVALCATAQTVRAPVVPPAGFRTLLARPSAHDAYYGALSNLRGRIGRGDVVLMPNGYAGLDVASITGARVVSAALTQAMPDHAARVRDVSAFLTPGCDPRIRAAVIERYHVTKVLLMTGYEHLAAELGPAEIIDTPSGRWVLIDVPAPGTTVPKP